MEKIVTDEEHQQALDRLDVIFDAEPNTPEGDELTKLVDLIRSYEDIHYNL